MQINSNTQGYSSIFGSPSTSVGSGNGVSSTGAPIADRTELSSTRRELFRVLQAFDELERLTTGGSAILSGLPSARSDPSLNLDLSSSSAALQSVEEVNATPTSFTPFSPTWGDSQSDAFLTFGGVYNGSNGSGVLSFEARRGGVHGEDRINIRVRDPDNNIMKNITVRENHDIDRQYNLGNGLFFTLGEGNVEIFDTTTIEVFDTIGSVVDPDQQFNATGNNNPNFEYGLPGIVAGSFTVNGETIAVSDDDTLNDVLNTINQSAAGVTAVFNPVTERIDMVSDTPGSDGVIEIVAGDSNFVEATKLLGAVVDPGVDPQTLQPLDQVAQFAGVQSGEVMVNGQVIVIDADNDSLTDIIERINSSDTGAVASFDEQTQRVTVTGEESDEALVIDSNGTGLFGALNMSEGQVDPSGRGRGYAQRKAHGIVSAMNDAVNALNEFFKETRSEALVNKQVASLRNQLSSAFRQVLDTTESRVDTGFGLSMDLDAVGKEYSQFATLDTSYFSRRLQSRSVGVDRLLNGTSDSPGLIETVGRAAQNAFQSLNGTLGTTGTLFDAYV